MGNKKMDNISTVKVNAYEIAKAPDIDFGYKSILEHFSIFVDRMFNYHTPEITDKLFFDSATIGKDRKDFIIGGGLVVAGDAMLRPLPIVAFSNTGGIFITNGLDVDNRPYQIPLGEDFTVEGYRIESIYIGNAKKNETIYGSGTSEKEKKKDPAWDEYESEWRASYQVGKSGIDTPFREFKKRQMQAVRFYVYPGVVELEKDKAIAAATPAGDDVFTQRVKIAEVLVHCTVDSGNMPHIQPIQPDDVRFVTATQYWEDNEQQSAQDADSQWIQFATQSEPNIVPGMTLDQMKAERERVKRLNTNRRAFRAEHYNYRWTADLTRTYRLGSVSEISERLYKIHKTDGTLKEAVVWNKHIFLEAAHEEALTGAEISIDHSQRDPIALPYDRSIKADERINVGLLQLAKNLRGDWLPISGKSISIYMPYVPDIIGTDSICTGFERISQVITKNRDRIDAEERARAEADTAEAQAREAADRAEAQARYAHEVSTQPHGATSSATAGRIAWRDGAGRMEVQDPVTDLQVVNIHYLNHAFKMDIVMKVLKSKYITTQGEFDTWISQQGNEAYTYVYLKGRFTASHPIGLGYIGTKEVTGIVNTKSGGSQAAAFIDIKFTDDNNGSDAGMYGHTGDRSESITNIVLNVTGRDREGRIVGFRGCTCVNCTANVTGDNGINGANRHEDEPWSGWDGTNGCSAIGFDHCHLVACVAEVKGGNGGDGEKGHDGTLTHYSSWGGGNGGNGGDAYSGKNCSLGGIGFVDQKVYGGDGGHCGFPGDPRYGAWDGTLANPGYHGNGGDVYLYDIPPCAYKAGGSYKATTITWRGQSKSCPDGKLGTIHFI